MNDGALRALEFDRIVEAVRSFALTPLGATAIGGLRPLSEARAVRTALSATTEGVKYLETNTPFALESPADLEQIVTTLAIEGRPLEAIQLIGMANFLASLDAVRAAFKEAGGGPFPMLQTVVEGARSFQREVGDIRAKIDPQGRVVDQATSELRTIRERLRKQRNRLRSTLESYLRGRDTAKYLQEQVITERDGRFVLIVRSEQRGAIPGIVHGSSGSGASLFLEPLSTVEINNDIVALEEDETKEIRRILLMLADALRKRGLDLRRTIAAATDLDVIQARANFSRLVDGVEPRLASDARIQLPNARHPLLIPSVRERVNTSDADLASSTESTEHGPVPVDIKVIPPTGALIMTGPNTGGKTVALKTTGLLVVMAQTGLHVPAGPDSQVAVFRSVFADIGDEQSIVTSLSTFSGHITNIVAMDRHLSLPALVLLDEVGAGTDPVEGGALGSALIEYLRGRGALVVATTHDDTLKSYASTTEGVSCAGFGFDPDTFAPTYELSYGSPGRSLALEIAARLGVAPGIIADARTRLSAREAQLANHLTKIEHDRRNLERERMDIKDERDRLAVDQSQLTEAKQVLKDRADIVSERLKNGIDEQLRASSGEIDTIIQRLRDHVVELERQAETHTTDPVRLSTGDIGALRHGALKAIKTVASKTPATVTTNIEPDIMVSPATQEGAVVTPLAVGTYVVVESLRLEGKVVATHAREAEVDVQGKRLHVRLDDIRIISARPEVDGGGITIDIERSAEPLNDLNVIGCTVDEALLRTEKFLDQAIVQEQRQLRIIHGHGTGRLRRSITTLLEKHPSVASFKLATPEHGGGGVTVIELKD